MTEALLYVLLWIPFFHLDAHELDTRKARMLPVAAAISKATQDPEVAVGVLTAGEFETHYAVFVGEGRCREGVSRRGALMPNPKAFTSPDRCDADRQANPRARTYWQLWRSTCPEAWAAPEGSTLELELAAGCAADRFRHGLTRCGSVEGAFAFYRHSSCEWSGAAARGARYRVLLGQYRTRSR
jgi:hypothetical protein